MGSKPKPRIKKTCPICSKPYETPVWAEKHGKGRTCSYECGRKLTAIKLTGRTRKPLVTVICLVCDKKFQLLSYKAKKRKYCSQECTGIARRGISFTPRELNTVKVICARCGKEIEIEPYRLRETENFYCNAQCQNPPLFVNCDWCSKNIRKSPSAIKDHNFCSRKCCRAWQGANGIVGVAYAQSDVICATCSKTFSRQHNQIKRSKNQYCTRECFGEAHRITMSGENNPAWRGGREPYYGPNWKQQSYRARKRDNFICQHCGVTEADAGHKLHPHHIIPLRTFNRDFKKANAIANLVSLCSSCHKFLEWHPDQMNQFLASWRAKTDI